MKNFKSYAFAAALVAGALALPLAAVHAESTDKSAATNSSGAITSQTFKALDTDKSGTLSESEFKNYSAANADFSSIDANGDGRLTLSEAQTAPSATPAEPNSMTN